MITKLALFSSEALQDKQKYMNRLKNRPAAMTPKKAIHRL